MDKLKTTDLGGFPFVLNDFRWAFGQIVAGNSGIYQVLNNLLRGFGDDFIVQGCVLGGVSGAYTLTEGWIMLGGELLKVDAQTAFDEATDSKFIKVTTYDSTGDKTMRNGATAQTYQVNRGVISGTSGNLVYNGNRLENLISIADYIPDSGSPSIVSTKKKIIEIGDWNMDAAFGKNVAHGLSDIKKIRKISVMIRGDSDVSFTPLNIVDYTDGTMQGGIAAFDTTNIVLARKTGGTFETAFFDSLSFNRGWVTIEYEL